MEKTISFLELPPVEPATLQSVQACDARPPCFLRPAGAPQQTSTIHASRAPKVLQEGGGEFNFSPPGVWPDWSSWVSAHIPRPPRLSLAMPSAQQEASPPFFRASLCGGSFGGTPLWELGFFSRSLPTRGRASALQRQDLVLPSTSIDGHWALLVYPSEGVQRSKTGESDNSMVF